MNKGDLINKIAADAGITKTQAQNALNSFIGATADALKKGDKITLVGFGTFATSERAARKGRNPQTGAEIKIPRKTVVKFKPGKDLSTKIM
ncbi:MAG: HU family DNA-binding protein [Bacteroidetes bacterium]|nr:HU family DNA-binding protein [Bacteroidota bacterium]